ncbi:hypothetical protein ASE63_22300 [Bosea sp. Root381]|uniref:GapR family DNA-binding domain-containing protein n=1 Tax=Bosea sp. Root381 TaxID=1736524 RepID=UPI0006FC3E38|nr:GapR family DNA-binding domain-containing protein [Bosea sp. Root381]KRE07433.1 hypothetical protein ASE63_22300 [Bosea sp. Root381]
MSDGLLAQTMQRIMSVLDEIDERKADIKEIYAEAKSHGFDKAAMGVAIREIRGRDKAQTPAAEERASIVELYVSAFDKSPRTYVHVPAREAAPRQSPSEGEVGSAVRSGAPVPEIATPDSFPAVQSEGAGGERPQEGSAEREAGVGSEDLPSQADHFVTPAGEGEGARFPVDPSPAADDRPVIKGLAAANAIAARASVQTDQPKRELSGEMPEIPAFLRRPRTDAALSFGEQA